MKQPRLDKLIIPLSLEDSCLAWLISDLEHYPPGLLALLPLRLRYRLLANLPVLDLCQLENNPVAVGVDLDSIWKGKFPPWNDAQVKSILTTDKDYQLSDHDDSSWSWRERYLHVVATTILCSGLEHYHACPSELFFSRLDTQTNYFYSGTVALDWLISLKGYHLLNEGGNVENRYDCQSLTNRFVFYKAECGNAYDRLTPPRYAHYKTTNMRVSDTELIALLMNGCSYKPKCLLDPTPPSDPSPGILLLQREACDTLKEFLNEVEEMQVTALGHWPNVPVVVLQSVCSGTLPKLKTIRLSSGYCLRKQHYPPLDEQQQQNCLCPKQAYVMKQANSLEQIHLHLQLKEDVLLSRHFLEFAMLLPRFVSHAQFRVLDVSNFRAPLNVIGNIVYAYLASPCSHKQTLQMSELVGTLPTEPHSATPSIAGQVLDSGVDYKHLTLHSTHYPPVDESYREVCAMLFNFPKICLNVLEVGCFQSKTGFINTLHMAAQHPDLHMRSLKIRLRFSDPSMADCTTFEDDLKALLQVPTLSGLILPVLPTALNPGNIFLPTIARELHTHPRPMQELDLGRSNFLELPAEDVEHLFQTIFSLPGLSQLTLKLAYSVLSLQHCKLVSRLWTAYGSGERLKGVICGAWGCVYE